MTYLELIDKIRGLGFPCAYGEFKSPPSAPYCVVVFAYGNDMIADNENYLDISNYQVELYHTIKHPPSEIAIQDLLKSLGLVYRKREATIENIRQVVYEIQLVGGY